MARKSRKKAQLGITEIEIIPKCNAAIYARISVEDKGREASSIENQVLIAQKFLENHKDLTLIDVYIDNGETGTKFERPGFLRLFEDLQWGRVNCIIVKDLSRFGRNYLETGNYLENIFPYMGVRFISVNDNFDSTFMNDNDRLTLSLKSILHDNYAKDISKKVTTAIEVKKKSGKFMNRIPPYGYVPCKSDKYKLEIHNEQAEVVRNIFRWRIEGAGPTAIARKLNDKGVPSQLRLRFLEGDSKGKESALWHGSTITNILKNPCYLGYLVERKTQKALYKGGFMEVLPQEKWNIIKDTHEPIISQEIFDKVQKILNEAALQKNRSEKKYPHRQRTENVFRGLLICGVCGSVLQRDGGYYHEDGTLVHHSYNCPRKYLKSGACMASSVREDELQEVVFEVCKRQIALLLDYKAMMDEYSFLINQRNKAYPIYNSLQKNKNETFDKEWIDSLLRFKNAEKLTNEMCHLFIEKIIIKKNRYCIHFTYQSEYEKIVEAIEKTALGGEYGRKNRNVSAPF